MQETVIVTLATMLGIVAAVFVVMLWRAAAARFRPGGSGPDVPGPQAGFGCRTASRQT